MESIVKLIPKAIFLSYIAKMIILSPTQNDVGIILALSGVAALHMYIEKSKSIKDVSDACMKELAIIKEVVNKQSECINLQAVEYSKVKNEVAGLKMKSDFRSIDGFGGVSKKTA